MTTTAERRRGRPAGSKDRAPRRAGAPWEDVVVVRRCKFHLLQILLYARDLVSLAAAPGADAEMRFLFAHTEGFQAWLAGRSIDSLGLQLRTWLRRDLLPLVQGTRFFTRPLPGLGDEQRQLLRWVSDWVRRGAPLDCVLTPLYAGAPSLLCGPDAVQDGSRIWHESRRAQQLRRKQEDELLSFEWTLTEEEDDAAAAAEAHP